MFTLKPASLSPVGFTERLGTAAVDTPGVCKTHYAAIWIRLMESNVWAEDKSAESLVILGGQNLFFLLLLWIPGK